MIWKRTRRPARTHTLWWRLAMLVAALVVGALALLRWRTNEASDAASETRTRLALPSPRFALAHAKSGGSTPSLADIAEQTTKSVVSVSSTVVTHPGEPPFDDNPLFRHFFGPHQEVPKERREHGLGSGVIVSSDGTILTNNHVVEKASKIAVILPDRRQFDAKVLGTDPKTDLAVLKLEGDFGKLTPLEMGDSRRLRLGDVVLAIGNPFGLGQTVTMGIVSATSRAGMGIVDYEDFIQTDAAINPGNSGGAMVNMEGKLVGINTAILSRTGGYQGIGFAIPTSMVEPVLDSIVEHGKVVRGWLGVGIQSVDENLKEALGLKSAKGVLISSVEPGSPAEKAGLRRGDVVVSFAGKPVDSLPRFRNRVAASPPGSNQKIRVVRDGAEKKLTVRLGTLPAAARPKANTPTRAPSLGLEMAPLSADARSELGVPDRIRGGVVVSRVQADSPAAHAGLRHGDVILEIDQKRVDTPAQAREHIASLEGVFSILVLRHGATFYVTMKRE